jgi:hypothetical protein
LTGGVGDLEFGHLCLVIWVSFGSRRCIGGGRYNQYRGCLHVRIDRLKPVPRENWICQPWMPEEPRRYRGHDGAAYFGRA